MCMKYFVFIDYAITLIDDTFEGLVKQIIEYDSDYEDADNFNSLDIIWGKYVNFNAVNQGLKVTLLPA